jgi:hypothetical protein
MDIEIWMKNVEDNMIFTLRKKMRSGKIDFDAKERKEWVLNKHPG